MYRNKKLKASANGAPCFMNGPACTGGGDRNDVCWRHSNSMRHGKATGLKAHDIFGFYGCQNCEDWFSCELEREDAHRHFISAWESSMIYACNRGVL